jgi:hypothetical protein
MCSGIASGVSVELQALVRRHHWLTFAVAYTSPGGKFSYRYKFTETTGLQVYSFRARVPSQTGFPFHAAKSGRVRVRVSG